MRRSTRNAGLLLALLTLTACDRGAPNEAVVARAAGQTLTVDEVVALLAPESYPNEVQVPYTLAELWVDYMLLGEAMARNPDLRQLDVSALVEQQIEQELILALRDRDVQPDTLVTDEEIERRFAEVSPGVRARARHIFLAAPQGVSGAERDSIRRFAEDLRSRVARGESLEQLAREHSNDPATAAEGGDLGWVNRGELFGPLDAALFSLAPGELSEVVESVYGYHVIRVEERQVPTLEDVRPQVRSAIQQERVLAAESVLVASVEEGVEMNVVPGAADLARQAAENPGMGLSGRARRRALVRYRGGSLTMGDLLSFMQNRPAQFRIEIFNAPDESVEQNLLIALAQRKLLAEAAEERGITLPEARRDSLSQELRNRLSSAAQDLGLAGGGTAEDRERRVRDLLVEMLRGTRDVTPLGAFSFLLRERYEGEVFLPTLEQVVRRIGEMRGAAAPAAPEQPVAPVLPPAEGVAPGAAPLPPVP